MNAMSMLTQGLKQTQAILLRAQNSNGSSRSDITNAHNAP